MEMKLKETLIGLATDSERYLKFKKKVAIPVIVIAMFLLLFDVPLVITKLWLGVAIGVILLFKSIEAIERNKLITDRNKLSYIILSSADVWYYAMLFFIAYPLVLVISNIFGIIGCVFGCIIIIFAISLISKALGGYFDDKLKKMEMMY
jgi:hypothetical protein